MYEQIYFNVCLYLVGYLFLLNWPSLSVHLRHIMAFLGGMAIWGIISTLLIVTSVPLSPVTIASAVIVLLVPLYYYNRRLILEPGLSFLSRELFWASIYCSLFISANLLLARYNHTLVIGDSFMYLGIGRDIVISGYFPPPGLEDWEYFLRSRMSFLATLVAGATFFNIELIRIITPLAALYFAGLLTLLFYQSSEKIDLRPRLRFFIGLVGALLMVTVPGYYLKHAYYINQNLFTAIFFTTSIAAIYIYDIRRESQWLVISAICLGATTLMRTEMNFFAVIPIVALLGIDDIKRREYALFLFSFVAVALPLQIFIAYKLGMSRHYHGWPLGQVLVYLVYLTSYFIVHLRSLRSRVAPRAQQLLTAALVVVMLAAAIGKMNVLGSITDLLSIVVFSEGTVRWGVIWIAIAAVLVTGTIFNKDKDKSFDYWVHILLAFFMLRIVLYSLGLFREGSNSQFYSGSRILLHIMPVGIMYMLMVFSKALASIAWFKDDRLQRYPQTGLD